MGIKEGYTEYRLIKPIKYAFDGSSQNEASFIKLNEPKGTHHSSYYRKIRSMYSKLLLEWDSISEQFADEEQKEEKKVQRKLTQEYGEQTKKLHEVVDEVQDEVTTYRQLIQLALPLSEKVDSNEFVKTFRKMCLNVPQYPIAEVDGKIPITKNIWDRLNVDDEENMAIEWTVFFVTALTGQKKNLSGQQSALESQVKEV